MFIEIAINVKPREENTDKLDTPDEIDYNALYKGEFSERISIDMHVCDKPLLQLKTHSIQTISSDNFNSILKQSISISMWR